MSNRSRALIRASQAGQLEVVKILIKNKANMEYVDQDYGTLMTVAAEGGHISIVN